jgi:hypothetical protein
MNRIASGAEGNVFQIKNKTILKQRKKNSDNKEFRIQQVLYPVAPHSIVRPIDQFRTLQGDPVFLMDFLDASNFKEFPHVTRHLVCQVLEVLARIHRKYPSFRHNDLHLNNVMVTAQGKPYIVDFGLAYIDLPMMNHVTSWPDYGIVVGNDQRYDYHFFINCVYLMGIPALSKLIERVMPPEYLGQNSPVIHNFRLRWNVKHTHLPSRRQLIKIFCP